MGYTPNYKSIKKDIEEGYNFILVFTEKHGDRQFIINNLGELHRACLKILKQRFNEGYWYYKPEEPEKPSLTDEQRAALPEGIVKQAANQEVEQYQNFLKRYKRDLAEYQAGEKALKEKDGIAAYYFLVSRSQHEYEDMNIERAEEIPEE